MKKLLPILFVSCFFICVSSSSYAQFNKLRQKIKDKIAQRVDDKENKAIDKTLDDVEGTGHKNGNTKDNNGGGSSDGPQNKNGDDPGTAIPTLAAYQNYDFVPGDTVLFADDFSDDQEGEFPAHWSLVKGQGTVNKSGDKFVFNILNGNYAIVEPRMKNKEYLGDNFTIELDAFAHNGANCGYGLSVLLIQGKDQKDGDISVLRYKSASAEGFPQEQNGVPVKQSDDNFWNHWHHIAIAYKNPQIKVYLDQTRVLVLPDESGFTPHSIQFGGIAGDESCPISITNVRIASGGNMNMVGKKFTESKIITHGINFDVDKSTLKPESMGTLNMIVNIMKNNPDIKFEIDGHTDNDGTAEHNLALSQQRADAVKDQLVKMGIDGSRLTAKGFGDTKPISYNNSPEGKANNRRVEFVKM